MLRLSRFKRCGKKKGVPMSALDEKRHFQPVHGTPRNVFLLVSSWHPSPRVGYFIWCWIKETEATTGLPKYLVLSIEQERRNT